MPVPFAIPKSLNSFSPVLEWLSEIPEEQLDQDPVINYLDSFLRSRYGKLEFADAELRIESDRQALKKLSEAHGKDNPWLYFLSAYLTPHIIPYLLEEADVDETCQLPPFTLKVELPEAFQVAYDYGSVLAKSYNAEVLLFPTAESVLEFKLNNLRQRAKHYQELANHDNIRPRVDYYFSQVNLESVNGSKVIAIEPERNKHREVTYLLKVPGGACVVEVHSTEPDFSEASLEESLRTISVESASSD